MTLESLKAYRSKKEEIVELLDKIAMAKDQEG